MLIIDDLFEMHAGYVLKFTDRTFSTFFAEELGISIDDPKYALEGTSKAKRLRYFLKAIDVPTAVRTLNALWEYREALRERSGSAETVPRAKERLDQVIVRMQGGGTIKPAPSPSAQSSNSQPSSVVVTAILSDLIALPALDPHPRGYAFEKFLKRLFDAYGLEARDAFKLTGEQIDGSFQLGNETYLLEAKWQNALSGVADLHGFHGKLEQKAAWTRGVFISNNGFSPDGLEAFGRGKRLICMDGYDLYELLNRNISLSQVLERKVRHAAETGVLFARVGELFPA